MWQQLWFVTNMAFVTLVIVYLFLHRSVTTASQEQDAGKLAKAKRARSIAGVIGLVAFILMALFFLINMRVNR
ncbi:hypothetical protein [Paenibacillus montanisoli]|uniref:Uncharacterized protein n=1 Tax=Paenibacillus montanisoli TaxID=2081970 RepID=A0A328U3Y2_9BACL|nr:hypothetical protein [Paenibacillus montanisoli]RAP76513.1 hypothetical protein DL346_14115 [Paenibacillus montanisoli]